LKKSEDELGKESLKIRKLKGV